MKSIAPKGKKGNKKSALPDGSSKICPYIEITLDHSFLSDSRNFFV